MQKNIDTTPVEHQTGGYGPKEKCLTCSEEFFFSELKDHVKHCKSPNEIDTALPEICHPVSPEFPFPTSPDRDNSSSDTGIIDLTDDQVPESLEEWRAMRSQQDQEYQDCLLADQEKSDLQKKSAEMEERRIKAISERQLRLIGVPEQAHGIPLRFKYPSGITRTRRFVLTESIQILFDFVGEDEDATEYFHIQDALSVTRLNSNMSGTFLDNNIIRSQTLYVHWIQPESPEVRAEIGYRLTFAVTLHSMFTFDFKEQRQKNRRYNMKFLLRQGLHPILKDSQKRSFLSNWADSVIRYVVCLTEKLRSLLHARHHRAITQ
ncbi:uncharacterized protein LOC109199129 [Oreochromis niloticus]|uniref:uncharacterized protein LOC109199129 n=1 Tax=Oreochromis niloticus TaxID=8128 RepID=UPI000DF1FFFB|nr:uncharacterized protein LOC109199129 [Oreochromis niloticus]